MNFQHIGYFSALSSEILQKGLDSGRLAHYISYAGVAEMSHKTYTQRKMLNIFD